MTKPEPPGTVIERSLEALGMTAEGLAAQIPCSPTLMDAIIYESHQILPMMAKKLGKVLGGSEQYWLGLDKSYRDHLKFLDTNGLSPTQDELG